MKKKLTEMNDEDAFYLWNAHTDGGRFIFPRYHGYHDNGFRITNSFSLHLFEANKERLFERFEITESEYKSINNPEIVVSLNAKFPNGVVLSSVPRFKIIKEIRNQYGGSLSQFKKRKAVDFKTFCQEKGIEITKNTKKTYQLI